MAFGPDVIGFYLQVEDQVTPTLNRIARTYERAIDGIYDLNERLDKSVNTITGRIAQVGELVTKLPKTTDRAAKQWRSPIRRVRDTLRDIDKSMRDIKGPRIDLSGIAADAGTAARAARRGGNARQAAPARGGGRSLMSHLLVGAGIAGVLSLAMRSPAVKRSISRVTTQGMAGKTQAPQGTANRGSFAEMAGTFDVDVTPSETLQSLPENLRDIKEQIEQLDPTFTVGATPSETLQSLPENLRAIKEQIEQLDPTITVNATPSETLQSLPDNLREIKEQIEQLDPTLTVRGEKHSSLESLTAETVAGSEKMQSSLREISRLIDEVQREPVRVPIWSQPDPDMAVFLDVMSAVSEGGVLRIDAQLVTQPDENLQRVAQYSQNGVQVPINLAMRPEALDAIRNLRDEQIEMSVVVNDEELERLSNNVQSVAQAVGSAATATGRLAATISDQTSNVQAQSSTMRKASSGWEGAADSVSASVSLFADRTEQAGMRLVMGVTDAVNEMQRALTGWEVQQQLPRTARVRTKELQRVTEMPDFPMRVRATIPEEKIGDVDSQLVEDALSRAVDKLRQVPAGTAFSDDQRQMQGMMQRAFVDELRKVGVTSIKTGQVSFSPSARTTEDEPGVIGEGRVGVIEEIMPRDFTLVESTNAITSAINDCCEKTNDNLATLIQLMQPPPEPEGGKYRVGSEGMRLEGVTQRGVLQSSDPFGSPFGVRANPPEGVDPAEFQNALQSAFATMAQTGLQGANLQSRLKSLVGEQLGISTRDVPTASISGAVGELGEQEGTLSGIFDPLSNQLLTSIGPEFDKLLDALIGMRFKPIKPLGDVRTPVLGRYDPTQARMSQHPPGYEARVQLAEGGFAEERTFAEIGEAGAEWVLPVDHPNAVNKVAPVLQAALDPMIEDLVSKIRKGEIRPGEMLEGFLGIENAIRFHAGVLADSVESPEVAASRAQQAQGALAQMAPPQIQVESEDATDKAVELAETLAEIDDVVNVTSIEAAALELDDATDAADDFVKQLDRADMASTVLADGLQDVQDEASAATEEISQMDTSRGGGMRNLGLAAAGTGAAAFVGAALELDETWQQQMRNVRNAIGRTEEEFASFSEFAKDAMREVNISADDMFEILRAGADGPFTHLTEDQMKAFVTQAGRMSHSLRAFGEDAQSISKFMAGPLANVLDMNVEQSEAVMSALARITQQTHVQLSQLMDAIAENVTLFNNLNVEDKAEATARFAASIATVGDTFGDVNQAAKFFNELLDVGNIEQTAPLLNTLFTGTTLENLGDAEDIIKGVREGTIELNTVMDALIEGFKNVDKNQPDLRHFMRVMEEQVGGGVFTMETIVAIQESDIERGTATRLAQDAVGEVQNSGEMLQQIWAEQQETLAAIQQRLENLAFMMKDIFVESLGPVLDFVVPIFETVTDWFDSLDDDVKTAISVLGGLTAGFGALASLATIIGPAIGTIGSAIGAIAGIGAGPLIAIGAAIGGIAVALDAVLNEGRMTIDVMGLLEEQLLKVPAALEGLPAQIEQFMSELPDMISEFSTMLLDFLDDPFAGAKADDGAMADALQSPMGKALNSMLDAAGPAFEAIGEVLVTAITSAVKALPEIIFNALGDMLKMSQQWFALVFYEIPAEIFEGFADWLEDNGLEGIAGGIRSLAKVFRILGGVVEFIGDALHGVFTFIGDAITTVNEIVGMAIEAITPWVEGFVKLIDPVIQWVDELQAKFFEEINPALQVAVDWLQSAFEPVQKAIDDIDWDSILSFFEGVFKHVKAIGEIFAEDPQRALQVVFESVVDKIVSAIEDVVSGPVNAMREFLIEVRDIQIFNLRPFEFVDGIIQDIPQFAEGAILRSPTLLGVAGEAGPEAILPLSKGGPLYDSVEAAVAAAFDTEIAQAATPTVDVSVAVQVEQESVERELKRMRREQEQTNRLLEKMLRGQARNPQASPEIGFIVDRGGGT